MITIAVAGTELLVTRILTTHLYIPLQKRSFSWQLQTLEQLLLLHLDQSCPTLPSELPVPDPQFEMILEQALTPLELT